MGNKDFYATYQNPLPEPLALKPKPKTFLCIYIYMYTFIFLYTYMLYIHIDLHIYIYVCIYESVRPPNLRWPGPWPQRPSRSWTHPRSGPLASSWPLAQPYVRSNGCLLHDEQASKNGGHRDFGDIKGLRRRDYTRATPVP